ncbi:MAG TPA: carboxy terminal-processing peptidase [Lacipirellulaceae bacterium]|jgi:carboxyl-terminal processing protease
MNRITRHSRPGRVALGIALVVSLAGSGLWFALPTAQADPTQPSASDRQIALAVSMLMERQHLSGRRLDTEISQRTFDTFVKNLDPLKLFFYQSDIDEFKARENDIATLLKRGDIQFAYDVFGRFLKRVDERIETAEADLDQKYDFTVDESMVRDKDTATFPKTPEEAAERWRQRVKFDLLKETEDGDKGKDPLTMDKAVEKLKKRYASIRKSWHQTDNDELLERFLTSMTTSFDPHSDYMSPSNKDNFDITMKLELDGIGASLRGEDGYTVVHNIIPGGAADKDARLKPEDKIVGVGQGTEGQVEDIVDMKLNDVVEKIRGKRKTVVRLEVDPADGSPRKTYAITRDRIELKDSEARSEILERGQKPDGTPFKIGVIQLPSFYMDMDGARLGLPDYKSTTRDVRRLLEEFNAKGVDAVVVDLRWNGGGSLTEAVNMTGLFIDSGPVVQVKGPDGRAQPYQDPEPGMVWKGPLVVMINKFSASASEIFAGAIQDYDRGIIVGDHSTHGKGTVQQMFDLGQALFRVANNNKNLGALKLTIQQFYRPGGDSTQNKGVESDIELPSLTTELDVGESDLDYAMKFDRVQPLQHDDFHMEESPVIQSLKSLSQERVTKSDFFAREERRINRYKEEKDSKTVTLNREKFEAERKDLNSDKEEEKIYDDISDPNRPVFKMDDYDKEALDITVDYLKALGGNKVAVAHAGTAQAWSYPSSAAENAPN